MDLNGRYGAIPLTDISNDQDAMPFPKRSHILFSAFVGAVLSLILITSLFFLEPKSVKTALPTDAYIPLAMRRMMDEKADPCNNFYEYACGSFLKTAHIDKDEVEWSPSWDGVAKRITDALRKELEHDTGKAGMYYRACMDVKEINKLGAKPLEPYMRLIDSISNHKSLIHVMAILHTINVPVFFDWEVIADPKDPLRYVFGLIDGGTTLPEARYYLDPSPRFAQHRKVYGEVVASVLQLAGVGPESEIQTATKQVIDIETAISRVTLPNFLLRGAPARHLTLDEVSALAPSLDFPYLFETMGAEFLGRTRADILCKDTDNLIGVSKLINETLNSPLGLGPIKSYLKFRAAYTMGSDLSDDFLAVGLLLGKELTGVERRVPREQKCYDATKSNMPDNIAKLFVARHFDESVRASAEMILSQLRYSFGHDLTQVSWMSPPTRQLALEKLHNMFFAVGYGPWQNYTYIVSPDSYLENTNNAKIWGVEKALERVRKSVDRERWGSTDPTQTDAFYGRQVNGLFVPAGVLQSPFFSASFAPPRNYGSLGAVMGHEITHGFDDVGRRYDMNAKEVNWWTPQDVSNFKSRAACIADYYADFVLLGKHVNGNMTLPEDIADMGGVKISFHAMQRQYDLEHKDLTNEDQRLFFLAWGQTWCSVTRPETERMNLLTDEHAPDRFRAVGPLAQFPQFAKTFQCPVGSQMNPRERCELW